MRKRWKILTVALVMLMLVSGLFAAVAAENDPPADPDTTVTDLTNSTSTISTASTEPTEPSDSTEPTDTPPTDNPWGSTDPTEPSETAPTATEETGEPTVTETTTMPTTTVTAAKPTYTTRPIVTTTTTTAATEAIIGGVGEPTMDNWLPLFSAPTLHQSQKTPSTDSDDGLPFEIGKVVLYTIIALLIMVGGGVAIYFITKHQAATNGKH